MRVKCILPESILHKGAGFDDKVIILDEGFKWDIYLSYFLSLLASGQPARVK